MLQFFIVYKILATCLLWIIDMSCFVSIFVACWALLLSYVFLSVYCLLGLLWLLLQQGDAVSVLMNSPSSQIMCSKSQDSYTSDSQNLIQSQEQRSPDHCPLPLLLKKVSVQTSCTSTQHPHSASDDNPGLMCLWIGIQRRFTLDKYLGYMSGKSMQRLHLARFFLLCCTTNHSWWRSLFLLGGGAFIAVIIYKIYFLKHIHWIICGCITCQPGVNTGQPQTNLMLAVFSFS